MYLKYVNWSFKKVSKNWQKCVFWHIFVKLLKSFSESFWLKMYQKTDKSWDSLLGVFCYFWHIFVTFLLIPYLIQTLKTIKNVSKLNFYFQKCIKKVTKVCLLTHFCHIFGYLGWRMTLSNLSPHTKFVHKYIQWTKLWTDFGHDPIKYLGDDHESLGQNIALRFYSIPYQWI